MPSELPVTTDEQEEDRFEGIHVMPTGFYGGCPFRGFPFTPELDERCPPTAEAWLLPVADRPTGKVPEWHGQPVPVVHAEGYCAECLRDRVREREAGVQVSSRSKGLAEHHRGRKRR